MRQGRQVAESIRELRDGEVKELREMTHKAMGELEKVAGNIYTWRGCRTCAGHVFPVFRGAVRSLQETEKIVSTCMLTVSSPDVLRGPEPGIIPGTVRKVRKAEKRAENLTQRIEEIISRFQRWSQVMEANEGQETQDD
jgi:hypothetical protein